MQLVNWSHFRNAIGHAYECKTPLTQFCILTSFIVLSVVAWLASDLIVTNCDESEEKRARRLA